MTEMNKEIQRTDTKKAKEINIKELMEVMKRKIWLIAFITIVITILGTGYSRLTSENLYESSTRAIISASEVDLSTLMVMVEDPEVLEKVVNELKLNRTADYLASQISVNNIGESQVVLISVVDNDPQVAADIANSTARIYKDQMEKLLNFNEIELLKEATPNTYPINGSGLRAILLSFLVGLVLSAGVVLILNTLDETIRSEQDIEQYGVPVIGKIPVISKKDLKDKSVEQMEMNARGDTVGI
ncbi:Wzz/FepE/Etk N-terminal domain-containing protein [Bacillus sp. E(2018)]|uniref:YveK family protein n=1 Tax=Bacillus sp. E(2018) TaxID=2502239 RepID=UPI00148527A8|nr:Wzz/FepE/Etk N-terminal domain-containing protein [Bacillus sp. E(2018)]